MAGPFRGPEKDAGCQPGLPSFGRAFRQTPDSVSPFVPVPVIFAAWLNDLDPIALHIGRWLQVRWYGIAYVLGFAAAFLYVRHAARRGWSVLPETVAGDFITYAALFGVMLGGRLGYLLIYDHDAFFSDPTLFFHITKGGMASHGGIVGLILFTLFYALKRRVSWTGLGDLLVVPAPLGILFGRLANFINGELWGHEAPGLPWAVKFPAEVLDAEKYPVLSHQAALHVAQTAADPAVAETALHQAIVERLRGGDPALEELLQAGLPERHPSQIYEALLEGALLFALLWWVRTRCQKLPHGILTGLFFIGYAVARIIGEIWRVPDPGQVAWFGFLTPGQRYSLPMILIGIAFIWAARSGRTGWPGSPAPREAAGK